MKYITINFSMLLLLLLTTLQVEAQQTDNGNFITWNSNYQLTYDDFLSKPGNGPEVALTSSGINFMFDYNGKDFLLIQLSAQFDKSASWFKEEGKVPQVLAHEQTHFDITELNVRLLRKAILERSFRKESDITAQLQRMYDDFVRQCTRMQNDYDRQTAHGTKSAQQKDWTEKTNEQLKQLEKYNAIELRITVK